jgi:predicted outer membrane repeat protein
MSSQVALRKIASGPARLRAPLRWTKRNRGFRSMFRASALLVGAAALIVGMLQVASSLPAFASGPYSFYVTPSGTNAVTTATGGCTVSWTSVSNPPCSLQTALAQANTDDDNDSIMIASGTYDAPTTGFTAITGSQVWIGENKFSTILEGTSGMSAAVVTVAAAVDVTMQGLTITGASGSPYGGAISNNDGGNLSVTDDTFSDNTSLQQGGAIMDGNGGGTGTLSVMNSTFSGNSTGVGGGAIDIGDLGGTGIVGVYASTFSDNNAADGAAIDSGDDGTGTLSVINSAFSGNTASSEGGAIDSGDDDGTGTLSVSGSTFSGNSGGLGGAIDSSGGANTLSVNGSTFSDNTASDGGAIISSVDQQDTLSVTGSTFSGNSAANNGGAIDSGESVGATLSVTGSTFSGNTASHGGAIDSGDDHVSGTDTATVAADVFSGSGSVSGSLPLCDQNSSTWSDDGYNVGSDTSCFSSTPATGDNPSTSGATDSSLSSELGPLADNDGPTDTIELLSGNPGLGDIPNEEPPLSVTQADGTSYTLCPVAADQRGISSALGASCDSGAIQSSFLATVNGGFFSAITFGQSATFAVVQGIAYGASGTITFSYGGSSTTICSFSYPATNSCSTDTLAAGFYDPITATFTPQSPYSPESSAESLSLSVNGGGQCPPSAVGSPFPWGVRDYWGSSNPAPCNSSPPPTPWWWWSW